MSNASHGPDQTTRAFLEAKARWVWRETLRVHRRAPETRIASSLSCVEIFVTLYYGGLLRQDPSRPLWPGRDRCIISKGHGSLCMYPILADLGFFPQAELERAGQEGSFLGSIPDPLIPGYETINGSLGHGLGVAAGMALALERRGLPQRVFVVVGDGELHEGSNWEAIMFAAHHRLGNLTLIVDDNRTSMLGHTATILDHGPLQERFASFGWQPHGVDGHAVDRLWTVLTTCRDAATVPGPPQVVIARTLKGRGVPGLENAPLSHVMSLTPEVIDGLLGAAS
jgi:transketolase